MKKLNNKGFVMIETIIVMSVLSIGLITLYSSYSLILTKTTTKSAYDNSEFIYKTYFIKKMLNELNPSGINNQVYYDASNCWSNTNGSTCVPSVNNSYADVFKTFNVEKIYIMNKDITNITLEDYDGSTINYLRSLDDYKSGDSGQRIIIKYKATSISQPQFATLPY